MLSQVARDMAREQEREGEIGVERIAASNYGFTCPTCGREEEGYRTRRLAREVFRPHYDTCGGG